MVSIDEADLVMSAAVAWRVDPERVLTGCDLPALTRVAGEAATAASPVDAAAIVLTGLVHHQPFRHAGSDHEAAAWLAAVHVLAQAGLELRRSQSAAGDIVSRARTAGTDATTVGEVLAAFVRRRPPAWRRVLRRLVRRGMQPRPVPIRRSPCPACDRTVELSAQDATALAWLGPIAGAPLLVARCGCRRTSATTASARRSADTAIAGAVPIVDAPHGPLDAFLALTPVGAVAFVPTAGRHHDGTAGAYDVAIVGEPRPSDLVGDWRRLVLAADERTLVAASAVRRDPGAGLLDVQHLFEAAPHAAGLLTGREPSTTC